MYHWDRNKNPPLSSILAKILAKVPIVWNFRSNLSSWSYCFRKYLQKFSACGAKFPLIFFVWDAILPCIRVQNHAKQDQKFSPAAQNGPLFRIQVTIFWNFQPKGSYCLKFSSKCLKRWYYRGGVLISISVVLNHELCWHLLSEWSVGPRVHIAQSSHVTLWPVRKNHDLLPCMRANARWSTISIISRTTYTPPCLGNTMQWIREKIPKIFWSKPSRRQAAH